MNSQKQPHINLNPFTSGCDCRHDLDHLTVSERKARLKYEHVQRCFSVVSTILVVVAMLGAFLMISPFVQTGGYHIIYPASVFMFVICTPCAVFGVIIKLVFWYANRYESFQRPCHYNTLGDNDE